MFGVAAARMQDMSGGLSRVVSHRGVSRTASEGSSRERRRNTHESLPIPKRKFRLSSLSDLPVGKWQQGVESRRESRNICEGAKTVDKEPLGSAKELIKAIDSYRGDTNSSPIDGAKVIMDAIQKCMESNRPADVAIANARRNGISKTPGALPSSNGVCSCCLRIEINVSGQIYETQLKTLNQFPTTLLGDAERRLEYFDPIRKQYFFNRNRKSFDAILHYYQTGGKLRRPSDVPVDVFADEIEFFDLGSNAINKLRELDGFERNGGSDLQKKDGDSLQQKVWLLFEKPESSGAARAVALVSVCIILLSVTSFCLETVPGLKRNVINDNSSRENIDYAATTTIKRPHFTANPFWAIESVCIVWFTIELVLRFSTCPRKSRFFCDVMNVIDLVSIVPYFVTTISSASADESVKKGNSLSVLRVVRLVRVFRILKLSRHSTGLQTLGQTLSSSFRELGLLLFFVLIGVVIFSSAIYFVEFNPKWSPGDSTPQSHFKSIPHAFWWAIVTMTTVGYGDMYPVSSGGKAVGMACAVTGILCLALPVPVIVSNFMYYYRRAVANQKRD